MLIRYFPFLRVYTSGVHPRCLVKGGGEDDVVVGPAGQDDSRKSEEGPGPGAGVRGGVKEGTSISPAFQNSDQRISLDAYARGSGANSSVPMLYISLETSLTAIRSTSSFPSEKEDRSGQC